MTLVDTRARTRRPDGTNARTVMPFTYGTFDRIVAAAGPFEAQFGAYAIISADSPQQGEVRLNGAPAARGIWPAGVFTVLGPNDRIEGVLDQPVEYESLFLCPTLVDRLLCDEFGPGGFMLPTSIRVEMPTLAVSIWQRIRRVAERQSTPDARPTLDVCVELLVLKLVEQTAPTIDSAAAGGNMASLRKAVDFIEANLGEKLDLRSIANAAGLSPFYFSRVFRAACGTTVHRFVLERRLQLAKRLLETRGAPISAVAVDAGFSSQSHLTTAFRQRFGYTPAAARSSAAAAS